MLLLLKVFRANNRGIKPINNKGKIPLFGQAKYSIMPERIDNNIVFIIVDILNFTKNEVSI